MDPKELEEKLERDNLTLKEHIFKLQNTIKQIKSEIVKGDKDSETQNNSGIKNNYIGKGIQNSKYTTKNNSPKREDSLRNYLYEKTNKFDNLTEDHHLKFSFNNNQTVDSNNYNFENSLYSLNNDKKKNIPKAENSITSKNNSIISNTKESLPLQKNKVKSNFYQENLERIRKEKEIVEKMETVKKKANLKKNYNDDELNNEEINKFHKHYNTVKVNKQNYNPRQSDDEGVEEDYQEPPVFYDNYLKSNKLNMEDLDNEEDSQLFKKDRQTYQKQVVETFNNQEDDWDAKIENHCKNKKSKLHNYSKDSDNSNNSEFKQNYTSNTIDNPRLTTKPKSNSDLAGLGKKNQSCKNTIQNYDYKSEDNDDSFEEKVKNIQKIDNSKYKNGNSKSINKKIFTNNTNSIPKKGEVVKNIRSLSKTKAVSNSKNAKDKATPSANKLRTLNPQSNNLTKPPKEQVVPTHIKNELAQLRKEVKRLNTDNQKLKDQLEREREKNSKFKVFAEDLIKFYEKTNKFENRKKNAYKTIQDAYE